MEAKDLFLELGVVVTFVLGVANLIYNTLGTLTGSDHGNALKQKNNKPKVSLF